jgi:hypothetical protein
LNNSLSDFNNKLNPGGFGRANLPAPEKRPLSSMTPTIIAKNSKPHWVIGSPGGQTIICTKRNCSSAPPTRAAQMAWKPAFNPSSEQRSAIDMARDDPQCLRSQSTPIPAFLRGHFLFLTSIMSWI